MSIATGVSAGPLNREYMLDRLVQLRSIIPALAEDLAGARRQVAALRAENRGLLAEVRRLQHQQLDISSPK